MPTETLDLSTLERGTAIHWRAKERGRPGKRVGWFEGFDGDKILINWQTLNHRRLSTINPEQVVGLAPPRKPPWSR
jgi:hypothetical protein